MSEPDPAEIGRKVEECLRVARSDRLAAERYMAGDPPLYNVAAFHCQQAAERPLKGFLVLARRDFGKTHDLMRLAAAAFGEANGGVDHVEYRRPVS
jgi:HEPN domain-containing protein